MKFKYGQEVVVNNIFFDNAIGQVTDWRQLENGDVNYKIKFYGDDERQWVSEHDLEEA